jgi:hypothetical protein
VKLDKWKEMRLACWRQTEVYVKDGDDEMGSKENVGEKITVKLFAECDAI